MHPSTREANKIYPNCYEWKFTKIKHLKKNQKRDAALTFETHFIWKWNQERGIKKKRRTEMAILWALKNITYSCKNQNFCSCCCCPCCWCCSFYWSHLEETFLPCAANLLAFPRNQKIYKVKKTVYTTKTHKTLQKKLN